MLTPVGKRRLRIDYMLLFLIVALVGIGLTALHSASRDTNPWHLTQLGWLVFGSVIAIIIATVDFRVYERYAYWLYGAVAVLLVLVLFIGVERNNATRWLNLGFMEAQPSEPMKLAIVLVTARYLATRHFASGWRLRDLVTPFVLVAVPGILVAAEPDLGTALVILAIFMTVVLFEGVRKSSLVILVITIAVLAVPLWSFGLKDYQRERVTAFLNPEGLESEAAWQVRQSIIAIASGGVFGKGHRQGSQVQSGFVPENENDFIFAHIGEEYGFAGGSVLLALYIALILWSLRIARHARDKFGVLMAVGIAALFFWHVFINIGMVLGLLPVVGLWLPFVSYGGSSLLTIMMCCGLLMNLSVRRHIFQQ